MVIAYVGAGGKTTLIRRRAMELRQQGKKVFVTTSTHMFREEGCIAGNDVLSAVKQLEACGYVMAGMPCGEKIEALPENSYLEICRHADAVLVEADGSKHKPLKFPAEYEPVIPENADEIIVVCGMAGLGKPLSEACQRPELVKNCLGIGDDALIEEKHILRLVLEGYVRPLKKRFPHKKITVQPTHDGSQELMAAARRIKSTAEQSADR